MTFPGLVQFMALLLLGLKFLIYPVAYKEKKRSIPNLYLMVTCHRPLVLPLAAPVSPPFLFLALFPSHF